LNLVISLITTLVLLGVVFLLLHLLILWLGLTDLVALLLFAIPITLYISYCTQPNAPQIIGAALHIYFGFAALTLLSAGLVFVIGQ
jgi:hypothetical protein